MKSCVARNVNVAGLGEGWLSDRSFPRSGDFIIVVLWERREISQTVFLVLRGEEVGGSGHHGGFIGGNVFCQRVLEAPLRS